MRAVACGLVLAALPASALAGSVLKPSTLSDDVTISGTGCTSPSTATVELPPKSVGVTIRKPQVGDTKADSRITGAEVDGDVVRFTAVSTAEVCAPEAEWSDTYDYVIDLEQRETVTLSYGSYSRVKPKVRPRKVTLKFIGSVTGVKWRSFGGRRAVGFGTLHLDEPPGFRCTPKTCPGEGERFKVVLSRPSTCADYDGVYYGLIAFITTTQVGVIKPGREMASKKPSCAYGAEPL